MSVKFEFYLSEEDFDRLYAIKEKEGKEDLTGNEFAKELILREIHHRHPKKVKKTDE